MACKNFRLVKWSGAAAGGAYHVLLDLLGNSKISLTSEATMRLLYFPEYYSIYESIGNLMPFLEDCQSHWPVSGT